jgi:hypothetical protein
MSLTPQLYLPRQSGHRRAVSFGYLQIELGANSLERTYTLVPQKRGQSWGPIPRSKTPLRFASVASGVFYQFRPYKVARRLRLARSRHRDQLPRVANSQDDLYSRLEPWRQRRQESSGRIE